MDHINVMIFVKYLSKAAVSCSLIKIFFLETFEEIIVPTLGQ